MGWHSRSAGWYAYEGWSGVSINQVAADELSLSKGDPLEVAWFSFSDDGELIRESRNVTITSVISLWMERVPWLVQNLQHYSLI